MPHGLRHVTGVERCDSMGGKRWDKSYDDIIIEYKGSVIRAKTDGILFYCPLCNFTALTEKDLIFHVIAHATGTIDKRKPIPRRK